MTGNRTGSAPAEPPAVGQPPEANATVSPWLVRTAPRRFLLMLGTLLLITSLTTVLIHRTLLAQGFEVSVELVLTVNLVCWVIWGALFAVVYPLAHLVVSRGYSHFLWWGLHVSIAVLFGWLAAIVTGVGIDALELHPGALPGRIPAPAGPFLLVRSTAFYVMVLIGAEGIRSTRRAREAEHRAAQADWQRRLAEMQLQAAKLSALRSQLRPHFLFNALHAIGSLLIAESPTRAHTALVRLSRLLRRTLIHGAGEIGTVDAELDLLTEYLELEQMRLGDRLRWAIECPSELRDQPTPPLLVLPLVENAISHAIADRPEGGRLVVSVKATERELRWCVEDDGPGLPGVRPAVGLGVGEGTGLGIGLRNCRERLATSFGAAASLDVTRSELGGAAVEIRLPRNLSTPREEPSEVA